MYEKYIQTNLKFPHGIRAVSSLTCICPLSFSAVVHLQASVMAEESSVNLEGENSQVFTANPLSLINEFAAYLESKGHGEVVPTPKVDNDKHTVLLGQFARFLADHDHVHPNKASGIFNAFSTAFQTSVELDC